MKTYLLTIFALILFISNGCSQKNNAKYLVLVCDENDESLCGYQTPDGVEIIPKGKYSYCFSDTLKDFAVVMDKNEKCIAIDQEENTLFEVYWYDNGPDYLSDGLFRIIKDDKVGYADASGKIIIKPQYQCATPFEDGKAKVALKCSLQKDGEHTRMNSDEWFYINKKGEKLPQEGYYKKLKREPDNSSPCFTGEKKVLMVESDTCE